MWEQCLWSQDGADLGVVGQIEEKGRDAFLLCHHLLSVGLSLLHGEAGVLENLDVKHLLLK